MRDLEEIVASTTLLRGWLSAIRKDRRVEASSRGGEKKVIRKRVCAELLGSAPVLFDIVKRRFVRTSWVPKGP